MEEFTALILAQTSHGLLRELSFPAWTFLLASIVITFEKYEVYWPSKVEPCTQSILCARLHRRHKKDCPGVTVKINDYVEGIKLA